MSSKYNSLNQRTQIVADGRTINYTYDDGNRLWEVLSPTPIATIFYDLAGRRQTLTYPNLVTTTYTPNRAGFLTNLLTRYNQQTTINSFASTFHGSGRSNLAKRKVGRSSAFGILEIKELKGNHAGLFS